MSKYYLRQSSTKTIWEDLKITDLKYMANNGMLEPSDEIRKEGHKTWHPATKVKGLCVKNVEKVLDKNNE